MIIGWEAYRSGRNGKAISVRWLNGSEMLLLLLMLLM
jgi:hypothetical protein